MMGPRNDGRTGLTCPLSPSLTLSIALSPTDAGARAAFQSREKKERRKGNFTPLPLFPPFSFSLDIDWKSLALSRRLHANTDAIWRKRRRRGREREEAGRTEAEGRRRTEEGGREAHKSTFLTPSEAGGRATNRPGAHQDSLILPFRVGRRPKPTMGSKDGGRAEGKGRGRGK